MGGVFENRLINFSTLVLLVCDSIKRTEAGNHLRSQLIRSGTSVSLNYGEAQSAESLKDHHHKLSIILKELRESFINMKLIKKNNLSKNEAILEKTLDENNQLIAIFVKSIQTVRKKMNLK
ncbi:MAG: four helix bundle protein [Bacteroidetes bacterium]|nr:MAG: four helix bundle protein [Bacteroidota bacterium]